MGALLGIAFVAGLVTAISPCVLPVLPIIFAGSATGSRSRPYAVIAGLIVSFTAFTLAATALLDALGLPNDLLRNIAIAVVLVMAVALVFPALSTYLERPFKALGRRRPSTDGGGFVLGLSLGLLFTPCAGPIIAAVSLVAATQQFSFEAVLVTLVYALGVAAVLLPVAIATQRGLSLPRLRHRAPYIRQALGVLMIGAAVVLVLDLDTRLAANVPGYARSLQSLEESAVAEREIRELTGSREGVIDSEETEAAQSLVEGAVEAEAAADPPAATDGDEAEADEPAPGPEGEGSLELALAASLDRYGPAPEFIGIEGWINSEPLTLADLRGKVVVIDFWTYSCINCIRTLPHLRSWHEKYADQGLVIVGVHTPEFAFERERSNVEESVQDFGLEYPVALDPEFGTWRAWGNRFWPAKYFIDKEGQVRFAHFGEGQYTESELVVRALLAEAGSTPTDGELVSRDIADLTPTRAQTPETYIGHLRIENYAGSGLELDTRASYELPAGELADDTWALGGAWSVEGERSIAGEDSSLEIRFLAEAAHLVLGPGDDQGAGTVDVLLDGEFVRTVTVDGFRLYALAEGVPYEYHDLELRFSPGVEVYAFTFGETRPTG